LVLFLCVVVWLFVGVVGVVGLCGLFGWEREVREHARARESE